MSTVTRIVAVVGSRAFTKDDDTMVGKLVNELFHKLSNTNTIIISGGATAGADRWAKVLSNKYGFRYLEAPAFWYPQAYVPYNQRTVKLDKSAGLKRNTTIAMVADECFCIYNGTSPGSKHCMTQFKRLGKPVTVIPWQASPGSIGMDLDVSIQKKANVVQNKA